MVPHPGSARISPAKPGSAGARLPNFFNKLNTELDV
jgi:hypothetical protein